MVKETYFEANTYGIGQLITQRKMFVVPKHQRDFAWRISDVELFFDDITDAMDKSESDYFIGLVVLLGPYDGKWVILDGQQRLVTTTMIYSAMREWLWSRGLEQDANQIESEFIAVRVLGGDYMTRFTPNITNRKTFVETVVDKCPEEDIRTKLEKASRYSSNRLLIEANLLCREKVNDYVSGSIKGINNQTSRLFRLANYMETKVRVVTLDVSSEANAYTIFESLNARGNELAVTDLVKNYVFGKARRKELPIIQNRWQNMASILEDRNTDEFLKTFWTSQFGIVRKQQIYNRIKREYGTQESAGKLVNELLVKSEYYLASDDPGHDIWLKYGQKNKAYLRALKDLGIRPYRAIIMSAINNFERPIMEALLWSLIVLNVRHQIIGQRRTGELEAFCANLATQIHSKSINDIGGILDIAYKFMPNDEEFRNDFKKFSESKKRRLLYFLGEIENTKRRKDNKIKEIEINSIDYDIQNIMSKHQIEESSQDKDNDIVNEYFNRIGNTVLLEKSLFKDGISQFENSSILLTREIELDETIDYINSRQAYLAELALETWVLPHR